jgi:cytochrome b558/566, subunit B
MSLRQGGLLKLTMVFLALGSVLQFILQFVASVSFLPIKIPALSLLTRLGEVGIYLSFVSIVTLSFLIWPKVKALLPLGLILMISPVFTIVPDYFASPWWIALEVGVVVLGIGAIVESLLKATPLSLLNLPTFFMVIILMWVALDVDVVHSEALLNYLALFDASVLSFALYTLVWKTKGLRMRRALASYGGAVPALFVFLPLYFVVSGNRFMEIIMNMVMPSVFGIVFSNPYSLPVFVLSLSLALYFIVALALKGNFLASLGYFMIVTTTFLGVNGYHLILYMIYPLVGSVLLNVGDEGASILFKLSKSVQR